MRRTLSLAFMILMVTACSETPTGSSLPYVAPDDVLALQVGPDVSEIVHATSGTDVSGLVTDAWSKQQSIDLVTELDEAISRILQDNPMEIRISQSWMMPVFTGLTRNSAVSIPENQIFAIELQSRLVTLDRLYTFIQDPDIVWSQTMPLLQPDGSTSTVELTLCDSVLFRVINH